MAQQQAQSGQTSGNEAGYDEPKMMMSSMLILPKLIKNNEFMNI